MDDNDFDKPKIGWVEKYKKMRQAIHKELYLRKHPYLRQTPEEQQMIEESQRMLRNSQRHWHQNPLYQPLDNTPTLYSPEQENQDKLDYPDNTPTLYPPEQENQDKLDYPPDPFKEQTSILNLIYSNKS